LLREEATRLQLEQRRDEHEELAGCVEVELVPAGQSFQKGQDDPGHIDLAQVELVLQDERQEQVEGTLERVEIELELADDHVGEGTRATGRDPWGPPCAAPAAPGAAAPSAWASSRTAAG